MRRPRLQAGYTLIEVMMATGILVFGSVGLLALQQASTRANNSAQEVTMATQAARTWLERLQRDAMAWTQVGHGGITAADGPSYLSAIPAAGASGWLTPMPGAGSEDSYAFDFRGRETLDVDQMVYCTNIRLTWVSPGQAVRADVRTWWNRRGRGLADGVSDLRMFPGCGVGTEDAVTAELNRVPSRLRAVYASTVLRWSSLP